jgi:RNA polymerase sigma-70 factor, ECF subfamily
MKRPMHLDEIIEVYLQPLYVFALILSGNSHEAGELVLKVVSHSNSNVPKFLDHDDVKLWLFSSLYRTYLNEQHYSHGFKNYHHGAYISGARDRYQEVEVSGQQGDVIDALLSLKPQYRTAIALFYLETFSCAHIAQVLSIPVKTVVTRISLAKSFLEKESALVSLNGLPVRICT